MASVGTIDLESGTYEVILRKVGANNSNTIDIKPNNKGTPDYNNKKPNNKAPPAPNIKPNNNAPPAPEVSGPEPMEGGKRKGTRKGKASRKGKRGMSGYMKYAATRRANIIKEDPSLRSNVVAVAKKIGAEWRAMSDADKKKY